MVRSGLMSSLFAHYNHSHPDIIPSKVQQLPQPDALAPSTATDDVAATEAASMADDSLAAESVPNAEAATDQDFSLDTTADQSDLSEAELPSGTFRIFNPEVEPEEVSAADAEKPIEEVVEEEATEPEVITADPKEVVDSVDATEEEATKEQQPQSRFHGIYSSRSVMHTIDTYGDDRGFTPVQPHQDKDFKPTMAAPGSAEKLEVLAERVKRGFDLWHKDDSSGYNDTSPGSVRPRD